MALPITLDEIRPQVNAMFLPVTPNMEVKYTLFNINNQFKIAGIFTANAHVSTFTLDLPQTVPRQFIYEDLHNVIKYMKQSFQEFMATSHKYTTPFHQHTHTTIFYYLSQIHYRTLETLTQIQQSYPQIVDQLLTQQAPQQTPQQAPQPDPQPVIQPDTQPTTQNLDTHCPHPCCPRTPSPLAILQAYQPQSSQQQDQPSHIFSKPIGTPRRKKFKIHHIPPHTQSM